MSRKSEWRFRCAELTFWRRHGREKCRKFNCLFSPTGLRTSLRKRFERREGKVCYFNGHLPVFIHECEDLAAFRLFSSQW